MPTPVSPGQSQKMPGWPPREQRPHLPGEVVKTITKKVRRRG
jgi:hypothetical protein